MKEISLELEYLIETVRENIGEMSLRKYAEETGISHATLIRFLSGKPPSFDVLVKLCGSCGIYLDRVFERRI